MTNFESLDLAQLANVTGGDPGSTPQPPALPNCPSGMYPDQTYVNGQLSGGFAGITVGGAGTYINTTCKKA